MASTTYSSPLGGSTTQGLVLERKRLDDTSQATVSDGDVKVVAACFERHLRRLLDQHAFATLRESAPKTSVVRLGVQTGRPAAAQEGD